MKEFTILAPMRGKYEGHISLHGIERETIKEVEEYAKNRFLPDTKYVIVLDDIGKLCYFWDNQSANVLISKLKSYFEFPVWVLKSPHPDYEEGSFFSEDVISSETYLGEL